MTFKYSLLQIDTGGKGPANSIPAWILAKAKKSRLTRLPGEARQSNRKSRLECRKQMRASEGKKVCNLSAQAHYSGYTNLTRGPASRLSTSKYFKFQIALSRPVRYFL